MDRFIVSIREQNIIRQMAAYIKKHRSGCRYSSSRLFYACVDIGSKDAYSTKGLLYNTDYKQKENRVNNKCLPSLQNRYSYFHRVSVVPQKCPLSNVSKKQAENTQLLDGK